MADPRRLTPSSDRSIGRKEEQTQYYWRPGSQELRAPMMVRALPSCPWEAAPHGAGPHAEPNHSLSIGDTARATAS